MLAASMALVALAIFVVLSVVPRSGRQPSVVTAGGFAAEVPDRQRLDAMLKSRLAVATPRNASGASPMTTTDALA